ncbi:alanine racemase [Paraglaciecola sp.]|uniref:alanine racemase n=1 Tax=Paraglaciecola sp. TaxID=1920173 RepID=UPI003EF20C1D
MSRPAKITVDLAAIQDNCRLAQSLAPHSNVLAVVKADGYGHGCVPVANALAPLVNMFAVSCLEEALTLRHAGINDKILLLEGFFDIEEVPIALSHNCELVIHEVEQLQKLLDMPLIRPIKVWLKIDTGMHRLGVPLHLVSELFSKMSQSKNVQEVVLLSHFSCADNLSSEYTLRQLNSFNTCVANINEQKRRTDSLELSIANSAAVLAWEGAHLAWNRPGIMLYGLSPFQHAHPEADKLIPAMTFSSEIIAIHDIQAGSSVGYGNTWVAQRPSKIATVAVGYGDGYPRNAKSGTPVLVNGQRVPLVGRVSMDLISVDVTELAEVELGDSVILWGKDLNANEVASWADTIGYELVTRMPNRVKPIYING